MTDYEIGLLVGAMVTWPIVSILSILVVDIFVASKK